MIANVRRRAVAAEGLVLVGARALAVEEVAREHDDVGALHGHAPAQRRLRQMDRVRGRPKAAQLGHAHEGLQVTKDHFHVISASIDENNALNILIAPAHIGG